MKTFSTKAIPLGSLILERKAFFLQLLRIFHSILQQIHNTWPYDIENRDLFLHQQKQCIEEEEDKLVASAETGRSLINCLVF